MTKTQKLSSKRAFSVPLGDEKVLTLRVSEEKEGKKIAMLNVEPKTQKSDKVEFANIVAADSKEHKEVFRILLGAGLGGSLSRIVWGVKHTPVEMDEVKSKKWWNTFDKRGGDHSHHEGHGKEMMGKVLTLPLAFGRQLCFERRGDGLKVVVEQVDSEGKVEKSGVVVSADWEQHEMVKSELPKLLKKLLTRVINAIWELSSEFPDGRLHEESWGKTEYWGNVWIPPLPPLPEGVECSQDNLDKYGIPCTQKVYPY